MKYIHFIISILVCINLVYAVGVDNPRLPKVRPPTETGNSTFNQTYTDALYLFLDGSNANQDIDIGNYDFDARSFNANSEITSPIYFFPNRYNSIQSEYIATTDVIHYAEGDIILKPGVGAGTYTFSSTGLDLGGDSLTNANNLNIANWDTAYTHSQDNTQAHTDYLVNNDNDYMAGVLTNTGLDINQGSGIGVKLRGIAGGSENTLTLGSSGGSYTLNISGDTRVNQQLLTTSSPIFNMPYVTSIYYNNVNQDYKYVSRAGYYFGLQGQSSGIQSSYEYFTKDGDGTDNLNFILWAEGTPDSVSPGSLMQFGYITDANPALRYYKLATQPIGEGGSYPLKIYTAGNTDQIKLHTDGGVTMATLKSGANQAAAGAAANELWIDTADNSIKIGV